MNENNIELFDSNGNLLPLETVQKSVEDIYNQIENDKGMVNYNSCLLDLINPELQFDPDLTVNDHNFLDRNIYLTNTIIPNDAEVFSRLVRFWNVIDDMDEVPEEERTPIKLYINTPGGDLTTTLSIIDTIILSKTPVWTITISTGYSGGFFIGIVGDKRIAYPHSSFLFHEGSSINEGDAHKLIQGYDFYKKQLLQLKDLVINYTKFTESDYERIRKDDLWLSANEALEAGIIDEIATEII